MSEIKNTLTTDIPIVDDVAGSTLELKQSYSEQKGEANSEQTNSEKFTSNDPLCLKQALKDNRLNYVKQWVESGHKVDNLYFKGKSIIWFALTDDKAEILELLLQNGADPNATNRVTMDFPLLVAYQKKQYKVVELLFNHGANINCSNSQDRNMLTESIRLGDIDMFKYLIARKVDFANYVHLYDSEATIVDFIMQCRRYKFLKILSESGYKFRIRRDCFMDLIDLCIRCGKHIAKRNEQRTESKRCTLYIELLDSIQFILKNRIFKLKWIPICEETINPLQLAIDNENHELAHRLVFNGADLDAVYLHEEISDDPRRIIMEIIAEDYYEDCRSRAMFFASRREIDYDESDSEANSETEQNVEVEQNVETEQNVEIEQNPSLNKATENFVKFDSKTFHIKDESYDTFDEDLYLEFETRRQEKGSHTTSDYSDDNLSDHEWENRHKKYDNDFENF